ncbi:MAG: hypothetical protein DMF61_10010 [Blastocatellia bacterium AA13]|nr:MAG: hypothetical protein DMF61_10010 [Blastocatellia bacterium AA13]
MSHLTVHSKPKRKALPRNFNAEISGSHLLVPLEVATVLQDLSVKTADEFISYLHSFPSAIASCLNWDVEDVIVARDELVDQLEGHVAGEILHPVRAKARSYGALNPEIYTFKAK